MKKINFIENKEYKTNISIVSYLKARQYKFEPINEFDRERFYCLIKCSSLLDKDDVFLIFLKKINLIKERFSFCPLVVSTSNSNCSCLQPMIFNRTEVLNIISDIPENYIGDENI